MATEENRKRDIFTYRDTRSSFSPKKPLSGLLRTSSLKARPGESKRFAGCDLITAKVTTVLCRHRVVHLPRYLKIFTCVQRCFLGCSELNLEAGHTRQTQTLVHLFFLSFDF